MQQPTSNILLLFCCLIFTTAATAVNNHTHHSQADTDTAHPYNHHDGDLRLKQGEKWETDKALRQGMKNIRSATDKALQSAHANPDHSLSKQQADRLAEQIDQQIKHMIAQCKLPAEADAVLHSLLADMLQAAQQLKLSSSLDKQSMQQTRIQALFSIQSSLDLYPKYFNDDEWHTN